MRGLYVDGGEVRYREDLPALSERSGESRVRILKAGVCATDLALVRGYMNFQGTPGHEFVGVALEGPLSQRSTLVGTDVGDRVERPLHIEDRDRSRIDFHDRRLTGRNIVDARYSCKLHHLRLTPASGP